MNIFVSGCFSGWGGCKVALCWVYMHVCVCACVRRLDWRARLSNNCLSCCETASLLDSINVIWPQNHDNRCIWRYENLFPKKLVCCGSGRWDGSKEQHKWDISRFMHSCVYAANTSIWCPGSVDLMNMTEKGTGNSIKPVGDPAETFAHAGCSCIVWFAFLAIYGFTKIILLLRRHLSAWQWRKTSLRQSDLLWMKNYRQNESDCLIRHHENAPFLQQTSCSPQLYISLSETFEAADSFYQFIQLHRSIIPNSQTLEIPFFLFRLLR